MKALLLIMALQFSKPIDFTEALQSREVRSVLPTTLSSAEIRAQVEPQLMRRAMLSARVVSAEYLDEINTVATQLANGEIDTATARTRLKVKQRQLGYEPSLEDRGTIRDFSSPQRLKVVIETNVRIAQGYGQFIQGQTPEVLFAYPAQELFRLDARKKERSWHLRWTDCGGILSGGRMIARKDDRIWHLLGTKFDDSLGNPWPPFAFGSGMWVKDVSREEAEKWNIVERETIVKPQPDVELDADLKWTPEIRSEALLQALEESIGDEYEIREGVLRKR